MSAFLELLEEALTGYLHLGESEACSHESCRDALRLLEPAVVDDWHLPGCERAVKESRAERGNTSPIAFEHDLFWRVRR